MAQLINLRLSRPDQTSPWGFRLQGGKDFGTPLLIQKVNFGSLAEKAGLQVGDALVRVNNQEVYDVKHKDAQDIILRAGNIFEVTVQRGGVSTWKPSVTPIGPSPVPNRLSQSPQLVTKTSLARNGPPQSPAFGSGHNSVTKPFSGSQSPKINGSSYGNDSVKAIVNKQYNTPVGIYSEENIAETLTAQAEVLAGGVIGVNFKKNEKNYEASNSEVFRMVQEADKEPKEHNESELQANIAYFSSASHAIGGRATSPRPQTPVQMPEQREPYLGSPLKEVDNHLDCTQPVVSCTECRNDIIGVFVRIKDKSLHVECFKCATCGSSLKNVGYYNINNKLYCDIHAKMVAKQNPPAPNIDPVIVPPGSHPPLGSFNIIPNKNKGIQSPQPSTLSPIPFHHQPNFSSPSKSYDTPKPTTPISNFNSGYNHATTDKYTFSNNPKPRLPFLKPKTTLSGSAFYPITSNLSSNNPTSAKCSSQALCQSSNECNKILSESIATQMLIEAIKDDRSRSPTVGYQELVFMEKVPLEVKSLVPPNNCTRAISPSHLVIFPPEIPLEYLAAARSRTSTPQPNLKVVSNNFPMTVDSEISLNKVESMSDEKLMNFESSIIDVNNKKIDTTVTQCNIECMELQEGLHSFSYPSKFINVPPIEKTKFKMDVTETKQDKSESPLLTALKTAPERSFSPLPTFVDASQFVSPPSSVKEEKRPMTIAEALAVAPERSYKLPEFKLGTARPVGNNPVRYVHGYNNKTQALCPILKSRSLLYSPVSNINLEEEQIANLGLKSFPPVSEELKIATAAGDFDRIDSVQYVEEELTFDDIPKEGKKENSNDEITVVPEQVIYSNICRHPFTATGLHEPSDIPPYQRFIPENPHKAKMNATSPKPSIKNTDFLRQELNVLAKVTPVLGYTPSSFISDGVILNKSANNNLYQIENSNREMNTITSTSLASPSITTFSDSSLHETLSAEPVITTSSPNSNNLNPSISLHMPKTSLPAALLSKKLTCFTKKQQPKCINPTPIPVPDLGGGLPLTKSSGSAGLTAPRRGRGILNPQNLTPGARVPLCGNCNQYIRGPFITALGKIWCPEHFICANDKCRRPLQDIGFVEEDNGLYCEYCFEQFLAPVCSKCSGKIKGDCLNAIGKQFHPECFNCTYCGKLFGNSPFFLEDSLPYCENDWNNLFTTKCIACGFPIEAGDRWVEALNNNYHSPCFNCSKCKTNLEGQSFYAKGGRPYCKSHAR
ncbi:PDZ and LIM domain protein Zasp isoform X2 [Daktulosphaira vitifoliae]|uniref:PDZ and LIM domain protein Zasp isoform X2 n=1 Tax=Daktulosphaira vitifoliae TaxID=58002 RepID=UPI0021AA7E82|nr:PDZ and LIM domain protein Zasp isoform X2 [Daktulosphaira vitifoliae]